MACHEGSLKYRVPIRIAVLIVLKKYFPTTFIRDFVSRSPINKSDA